MKKIIALGVGGIAAVLFYLWANPPSRYEEPGLAPESQQRQGRADAQAPVDFNSERAQGARTVCRQKLGIKEQVMTGMEVAKLGYGSQTASAFNRCVVDAMYPVKK
jgi:hypothetical protein